MYKNSGHKLKSASFLLLSASILSTGFISSHVSSAQALENNQDNNSLEEIVVTARKISESLQDIPVAVTAFSTDSLQKKGLSNISQIGDYTPGLTLDSTATLTGSSSTITAFIRGIGMSDFLLTIDPGVGIYVDGVYVARSIGGIVDLLNLQRVEVLKGPQGTLFGRNTIGGAINIVSAKPGKDFSFKAEATIGRYNRRDLRMTVDVPLIDDKLYSSFSFSSKNRDGYAKRIEFTGPHGPDISYPPQAIGQNRTLGDENTDTVKAIFQLEATDRLQATLILDGTRSREHSVPSKLLAIFPGPTNLSGAYNACIAGIPVAPACTSLNAADHTPFDQRFLTNSPYTTYGTGPNFSNLDLFGVSLTLSYDITDNIHFKSITAHRSLSAAFGRDADDTPLAIDHTSNKYSHRQFTQELQLNGVSFDNKFKWLTGLFYFSETGRDNVFVPLGQLSFSPFLNLDENNLVYNRSYAAFGQATYNITSTLGITAGVRFTKDKKHYRPIHRELVSNVLLLPDVWVSQNFTDTSPHFDINYHWSENFMTYISASRGFKSGGWTGRTVDPQTAARPFKPETVWSYEFGFKSQLFDNRLRLNGATYYTNYSNLQLINQEGITPITVNAGKAVIKGAELELQALPIDNLKINIGLAYINARYTEVTDPFATINTSTKFANTPVFSSTAEVEYTIDLANEGSLMLHGDWNYNSTIYNNAENTPELTQPGIHLFNAAITYAHPGDHWQLVAGARNLTDKKYIVSGFNQPGVGYTEGTYARPREWYLTLRLTY